MIKLKLPECPKELTPERAKELTESFKKNDKTSVWNQTYIKEALFKMTNGKCAYSEQKLNEQSAYMEVEHFKCKSLYPDEVVKWGNLLPACKACNSSKRDHDVMKEPIVNPLEDDPKNSLYVRCYHFYEKNDKGEATINVLDLNNMDQFQRCRFEIGEKLKDYMKKAFKNLQSANKQSDIRKSINSIKTSMRNCGPKYEYSAVISTAILYEFIFNEIEKYLRDHEYWDEEFEDLKKDMIFSALPKP